MANKTTCNMNSGPMYAISAIDMYSAILQTLIAVVLYRGKSEFKNMVLKSDGSHKTAALDVASQMMEALSQHPSRQVSRAGSLISIRPQARCHSPGPVTLDVG